MSTITRTTITRRMRPLHTGTGSTVPAQTPAVAAPTGVTRWIWALTRLSLGWVFLWAFLDKTFGLGHGTAYADAWIRGGSPTKGFLAFGAQGPLAGLYGSIAGAPWANWLFMIGLAGIGIALILGIGTRAATAAGVVLLVMMYSAVLPPANNVFMSDHLIYALVLAGLAFTGAEKTLGFGRRWQQTALVQRFRWLA